MADGRILIADDEDGLRWVLEKGFRGAGYQVTAVKDGTTALREAEEQPFDLILLDIRMPGIDGLTLLGRIRGKRPDAQVVIMTAHGTVETAIQAMQQGAYDYLAKPFDLDEALLLAERALTARRLSQEVTSLKTGLKEVWEFGALVGRHPTMQEVYKTIGRVAASDVSVLLRGESGTGKEVVARALHHYSRRAGRPFVGVSAAAIPATLLESELFGHEKGAFTDAKERRLGKLELAHGGSVFFDEIGDMPPELQVKLLRALQERAFERVGGHELIRMDVRVLAATHRDLEAMMKTGRFREDLFYRLNVVSLLLPSLRERRGDMIVPEHLPIGPVSAAAGVEADASLEEIIEKKMVECVRGLRGHTSANLHSLMVGLVEKPLLRAVMRETKGNQVRAAQLLGINRNTLRKKLKEHGIDPDAG
ncbi:MAG: two-component system response regulator [Candidatus Rokuibacteriota bacterium]|nr:MAG: two-component system response regulator [Candidatus Rokubacteria bacterium]